jgi:hypothetical protein
MMGKMRANEYFVLPRPDRVIGKLQLVDNGYDKSVGCVFEGDLDTALAGQVDTLPSGLYAESEVVKTEPVRASRDLLLLGMVVSPFGSWTGISSSAMARNSWRSR